MPPQCTLPQAVCSFLLHSVIVLGMANPGFGITKNQRGRDRGVTSLKSSFLIGQTEDCVFFGPAGQELQKSVSGAGLWHHRDG
jgi:hypothetical protein